MGTCFRLSLVLTLAACGNSGQPAVGGSGDHKAPSEPGDNGSPAVSPTEPSKPAPPPGPVEIGVAELGITGLDADADPCTDFYAYVCGGAKGSTMDRTRAANTALLAAELAADTGPAGAFYRQCGDAAAREAAGVTAAQPLLEAVRAIKKPRDVGLVLGLLHKHRIWAGFSLSVAPDFNDGRRAVLHIDSGGLTLGDRDRYLEAKDAPDRGEDFVKKRRRYLELVAAHVQAAGGSSADGRRIASDVLRLEKQLAKLVRSTYERKSPRLLADRVSRKELAKLATRIDWDAYFKAVGAPSVKAINLTDRRGLLRADRLVKTLPTSTWRGYLEWHVLYALAPFASPKLEASRREIDNLFEARPAPVDTCAEAAAAAFPDLTGAMVLAKRLPEAERERASTLVSAIAASHAEAIRAVGWLTEETRKKAGDKVEAIDVVIGMPDWLGGGTMAAGDDFAATALQARARETARQFGTLGTEAGMSFSPLAAGARYEWLGNRVVLGAGTAGLELLRGDRPVAAAMGVLGTTAGYGIAMATGERGGEWNARGALQGWWTAADRAGFRESSACILKNRTAGVIDGTRVLARLRADRAGIEAAYRAYKSLPPEPRIRVRGANHDQVFFLAAANAHCGAKDGSARVVQPMTGIPAFAEAFQCKAGSKMNPAQRCR